MLELFLLLLEKAELVRLVKFVSAVLTFVLLPEITFLDGRDDLNRLPPQGSSSNHKSRTSLLNTQKNRKMKKP